MIKIIEDGKSEFVGYCCICGCKFTYELSDIVARIYVTCPYCGSPRAWQHPDQTTLHIVPQIVPSISDGDEALKKQMPKKPEIQIYRGAEEIVCPTCGNPYIANSYCDCYGRAIDWSEAE